MKPSLPVLIAVFVLAACAPAEKPKAAQLTRHDYLIEGLQYKDAGRIELSRRALEKAIAPGSDDKDSRQARSMLKYWLPKTHVSTEAEQRNVVAYNHLMHGDRESARKTFQDLIDKYPTFEWPYLNLAMLCEQENKLQEADQFAQKALKINPDYAKAWGFLFKLKCKLGDKDGARMCAQHLRQMESL